MPPARDLADEAMQAPDPQTSLRLFRFGALGLVAAVVGLVYKANTQDPLLTSVGVIIVLLGAWPALTWARKGLGHFPMFELFMLTTIPLYAVPLLAGHPEVLQFTETATWGAA